MSQSIARESYAALQVVDIIEEIVSNVAENDEQTANRKGVNKSLLSIALCCKLFMGPALDRLWRHMDNIVPILKLLPTTAKFGGTLQITGPVDIQSIPSRACKYAERVQELTYTIRGSDPIHPSSWIRLSTVEGGLLPRLKSFNLLYDSTTMVKAETYLIVLPAILQSRSLTSISIDIPTILPGDVYSLGPMVAIISDINSNITHLSLAGPSLARYTACLLRMNALKTLTLKLSTDGLSTEIISSLSCLPHLSQITLDFPDTLSMPFIMKSYVFPTLTKLTLRGPSTLENSLCFIDAPQLKQLVFSCKSSLFSNSVTRTRLLSGAYPSLQSIKISWGPSPNPQGSGGTATKLPLNIPHLPEMNEFVLTSLDPNVCVSEEEIAAVAKAWPNLTIFRIEHAKKPVSAPGLSSLTYLVQHCPQLTDLSISIKEDVFPIDIPDPVSLHRLSKLNLQHTKVTNHAWMARSIDGLFPNLTQFSLSPENDCKLVSAIIFEACQPVRKDQKKRDSLEAKAITVPSGIFPRLAPSMVEPSC